MEAVVGTGSVEPDAIVRGECGLEHLNAESRLDGFINAAISVRQFTAARRRGRSEPMLMCEVRTVEREIHLKFGRCSCVMISSVVAVCA